MNITWLGHSCFYIITSEGTRIITDPFDATVGYKVPQVEADLVTVSHSHFDHNYTQALKGNYKIINQSGKYIYKDVQVKGINTFHDNVKGEKRGHNVIFNLGVEGMNICHLGDLGHILDEQQVEEVGKVDILLVPVGGTFTINLDEAVQVVKLLNPRTVIPMHYKTEALRFNLDGVDDFLERMGKERVTGLKEVEITAGNLGQYEDKVIAMEY